MRLLALTLTNFMGASHVEVRPNGGDLDVYADNGVGKTTLFHAYRWLLFGKDAENKADFDIKPLDSERKVIAGMQPTVEATFDIDGETLTLKRSYREKWTTKRGSANKEFGGHETDFWINGVPVNKSQFEARVAGICDEKRLQLLSDPFYFCSRTTKWQDRRAALLTMCGDVTVAEVCGSDAKLAELPTLMGRHSIEDYRKILDAQRREINQNRESLPYRIDEARRAMPAEPAKDLLASLEPRRTALRDLQGRRGSLNSGEASAQKSRRVAEIDGDIQLLRNRLGAGLNDARDVALKARRAKEDEIALAKRERDDFAATARRHRQEAEMLEPKLQALREEYRRIAAQQAEAVADACTACGQAIPEERLRQATEAANLRRAQALEENKLRGGTLAKQKNQALAAAAEADEAVVGQNGLIAALEAELKEIRVPEIKAVDVEASPEYTSLAAERARLQAEIEELRSGTAAEAQRLDAQIREAEEAVRGAEAAHADLRKIETQKARIEELTTEERKLAQDLEETDRIIFLCEAFVRAKVKLLTGRINARFQFTSWQLFEEQVNGGLNEVCEPTFEGVPWGSLNHAARVNVGLDVIDAFATHFGFAPPIFIDYAESVTRIRPTAGQQVRLIVSEADKALRFVTHDRAADVAQGALL